MKMGNMKLEYFEKLSDAKVSADEKKAIREKIKDRSAGFKSPLDPNEWHTARVEVVGDHRATRARHRTSCSCTSSSRLPGECG
jgi:hypothetical protein